MPISWSWERWGNLSHSIQYGYNAPAEEIGDIRMVRISDIQGGEVLWATVPYCRINKDEIDSYLLKKDDILFARTGGTVGKSFLVKEIPYPTIYAGYLIRTRYSQLLSAQYMKYFMDSQLYWEQLKNGTIATAQPNCNGKTLSKMILPIPPYKEQVRITNKLNEVLAVVNKYGACQDRLNHLNCKIKNLLLKSILQEAIQGKLVEQDPNDEPASALLERIKQEKERLIKEKKIKRDKQDSTIYRDDDNKYFEKKGKEIICIDKEIPFEIPDTWQWCRVKQILDIGSARRVHQKDWRTSGIPFYRAREIGKLAEYEHVDNELFIDYDLYKEFSSSGVPMPGDLMITAVGTLGKVYIVKNDDLFYYKDGSVLCLNNRYNLNPFYLKHVIDSPMFKNQYVGESQGTTVATLTMVRFNEYLLPIPPLREQERIVKAIDNLASIMRK